MAEALGAAAELPELFPEGMSSSAKARSPAAGKPLWWRC